MKINLKAYTVSHLTGQGSWRREDTSVIIATSKFEASTFVEGEVLNVQEGRPLYKGQCLSHSSWSLDGWLNKPLPKVSEEWRQYLIRRHFDDGIED